MFWPGIGWTLGFALAGILPASAQTPADPFGEEVVAIKAQRIETVGKGVIDNGVIVIRNGKITAIGKDVKIPAGAKVYTANTVMPGMVAVHSQIGLSDAGGTPQLPPGLAGRGGGRFPGAIGGGARASANSHYKVMDELYPFDPNYEKLRKVGVTTVALTPGGRGIGGQGVVIRPMGETPEKMAVAPNSLLAVTFAANTQTMDLIRTTFEGVRNRQNGAAGPGGGNGFSGGGFPFPGGSAPDNTENDDISPLPELGEGLGVRASDDDMQGQRRRQFPGGLQQRPMTSGGATALLARTEPLTRALAGTIPTEIACPDAASTLYALQVFKPYDTLKPVYILGSDCYRVANELAERKASVVLPADIPFEPLTRNRINTAYILTKAGVKIACRPPNDTPDGYAGLRFKMGELIKYGLDRDTALKAITLTPAELLGVSTRLGSLEVGKDGNLLLLDGDPFAATTRLRGVLLEGKLVSDGD